MTEAELRRHRCCFTGHRPEKLGMTEQQLGLLLEAAIRDAAARQFNTFISGCAKGVDLCAAEIILKLRENDSRLKLICALPFPDFGIHWGGGWTERFRRVTSEADLVRCISPQFSYDAYQRRNEWMVRRSGLVIAVYQGQSGGTRNTLDYARKLGVPCVILDGTNCGTPD